MPDRRIADALLERIPPQNLDAEQASLGAMLLDREAIVRHVHELMRDETAYARMQVSRNPFGDGSASRQIAAHLRAALCQPALSADSGPTDIRRISA